MMKAEDAEFVERFWHNRKRGPVSEMLNHRILDYNSEEKTARAAFTADHRMRNPFGVVQGGFLAAMLDEAVTDLIVLETQFEFYVPTLTLQLQYFRPATGDEFESFSRILYHGRRTAYLQGSLFDRDGHMVVQVQSTTQLVPSAEAGKRRNDARKEKASAPK